MPGSGADANVIPASTPSGQPLAHQGLVIAPEPLLRGNCRLEMRGQTKRRLIAPLALRVVLQRTDIATQPVLFDREWVVTPQDYIFYFPPLATMNFDGESRLRLEVYSDPLSADGNVVLLSDAGRISRVQNVPQLENVPKGQPGPLQRLIGSVTIHTAPLCGESNFETVEAAGSCVRGYFTVPAMLATLQITRAPWVEKPLITRSILSAVGVAFAVDSYDPVERAAFPIAFQIGGFVQDLGEDRIGLLAYVGVAPTVPILGSGGNTTSIGLLGGLGLAYVANNNGPDEGVKPAAFLSVVVQVGQANPSLSGQSSFGAYSGGTAGSVSSGSVPPPSSVPPASYGEPPALLSSGTQPAAAAYGGYPATSPPAPTLAPTAPPSPGPAAYVPPALPPDYGTEDPTSPAFSPDYGIPEEGVE